MSEEADVAAMLDQAVGAEEASARDGCGHDSLRLHRTNRLRPATCLDCGRKLTMADLVARLLGPLESLETRVGTLEEQIRTLDKVLGAVVAQVHEDPEGL